MGLVDKVLESFKAWVSLEVEDFKDDDCQAIRSVYKLAQQQHLASIEAHSTAKTLADANPLNAEAKKHATVADKARTAAKKEESSAKDKYNEMIQRHNAKKSSLAQQFESIFSSNGVKREHYHGGKFNGVNCIRIMEKARELFVGVANQSIPSFQQKCLLSKAESIAEATVVNKCTEYARLLELLDAIWSTVRGIEAGLLPTNPQLEQLQRAIATGKALWLDMGLSTQQPKWHLTFDGHLLAAVKKFGGLADKADDTIEKFHQTLKVLRDRFRGTRSYKQRETCIRRELRRRRSPQIQQEIDNYEAKIQQRSTTKRKADTMQRLSDKKEAKKAKRDAAIAP